MNAPRRYHRLAVAALGALLLAAPPAAADTVVLELPATGAPDAMIEPTALSERVGTGAQDELVERDARYHARVHAGDAVLLE